MMTNDTPNAIALVRLTRSALTHLYDAAYLENHPLAAVVAATSGSDRLTRAQRLRRLLLDCVESLRPQEHDGGGPEAARAYAILTYRYIDGLSMEEIAAKRALSERQTYRELERGIEAVAALVRARVGDAVLDRPLATRSATDPSESQVQLAQAEVARLGQTVHLESLDPAEIVKGVLAMLEGLRERVRAEVDFEASRPGSRIVADRVMLRQALLNVLTCGIHAVAPGGLGVRLEQVATGVQIGVEGRRGPATRDVLPTLEEDRMRLTVAEALITSQRGVFATLADSDAWSARLTFPIAARQTILVVDDNQDLVALFRRYLTGHEVAIIAATDSEQVVRLASERQPGLITLDVMMPSLDGWDVLQRLKSTSVTANIPVVVCSVLNEPELARNLGATGYLRKPIHQPELLALLEPFLARPMPLT